MNPELQKKIAKRQEANREIVRTISAVVEGSPNMRFHQILHMLGVSETQLVGAAPNEKMFCTDLFHEESVDTLNKIKSKV